MLHVCNAIHSLMNLRYLLLRLTFRTSNQYYANHAGVQCGRTRWRASRSPRYLLLRRTFARLDTLMLGAASFEASRAYIC